MKKNSPCQVDTNTEIEKTQKHTLNYMHSVSSSPFNTSLKLLELFCSKFDQ